MPKFAISHLVVVAVALAACAVGPEGEPYPEAVDEPEDTPPEEPVGESEEPSIQGWLCGGLCASAGGLACALVTDTCLTATTVTVGGTAIPCGIAVVASCLGTLACVSLCSYDTPGID
jgi:hypothetical protein